MNNILAIDVGGTEIKFALVDENYNLTNKDHIKSPNDSMNEFLDAIYGIYSRFDNIEAIALSLPGFINSDNGKHLGGGCYHSLFNTNIRELVSKKCNCKVYIENDAKAATIAEYNLGNLKGTNNSAVFIIGTGVGGGIIIDKKLVKGYNYTAGEFSFLNVDYHEDNVKSATLAYNCSTVAMLKKYKELTNASELIDGRKFFELYHQGDNKALEALDYLARNIAIEIMNLGILLNIEKIAIGGGISAQAVVIEKIIEKMNNLEFNKHFEEIGYNPFIPEVVPCKFLNDANLIGVAYALRNENINEEELNKVAGGNNYSGMFKGCENLDV